MLLRHRAQEARIEAGIELVGVVDPVVGKMRELALHRRDQLQAIIVVRLLVPLLAAVQPEMLEAGGPVILAGQAEGMEIAVRPVAPAVEQDAQLEGRVGRGHELGLVDPEQPVVADERRDRAFADAHRADRLRFDQGHLGRPAERARDRGGGHPAGGAATGDHDSARGHVGHRLSCRRRNARIRAALSGVRGSSTLRAPSGICARAASGSPNT